MTLEHEANTVGFTPEEIRTGDPTRSARLKWVVVVDANLPAGRAVNAAVCVAAATSTAVPGLLGPDAKDAAGSIHPGLPWAGCSILGASSEQLTSIRSKAVGAAGVYVADMPGRAQHTRVYDEYLDQLATDDAPTYYAVSIVGPRNRVDKIVRAATLLP